MDRNSGDVEVFRWVRNGNGSFGGYLEGRMVRA